jgi:hypothetical protein
MQLLGYVSLRRVEFDIKPIMRVSYIGITLASQASEAGSTPATRSSFPVYILRRAHLAR